ncbi:MAG: 2,3-bisphosphoglycerate-independent phosphoglycerate mutase [Candidatus Paceibacterota bacterium]
MKQTVILCILDGWGIGPKDDSNPIYSLNPKTIKYIENNFPSGTLKSGGITVGLPWEEEGNSEVGHLTIGAGRTLYQHYLKISDSIKSGDFFENETLKSAFNHSKENSSSCHLIGLLSDGNVHASIDHLNALLQMAKNEDIKDLYLHLFTDGRDAPPKSAEKFIEKLKNSMKEIGIGKISTISGRYWAMDRDGKWENTKKVYETFFGNGNESDLETEIKKTYEKKLNDEYIEPFIINKDGAIKDNDSVIFFNFREDRIRQIAEPFLNPDFSQFSVDKKRNLLVATMTSYFDKYPTKVVFEKEKVKNTLGEVLANNNRTQLRVAESMKWAHITYFLNGLKEDPFPNEFRVLIPSEKIARPEESPSMRANALTERVVASLKEGTFDFIAVNYANPDVIAHTGNYKATKEAVEVIDKQLDRIIKEVLSNNHVLLITSDHGNAESVFDLKTGEVETKHNSNPVPIYLIGNDFKKQNINSGRLQNVGVLADVAPTILDIMNIKMPDEMTGTSLLNLFPQ